MIPCHNIFSLLSTTPFCQGPSRRWLASAFLPSCRTSRSLRALPRTDWPVSSGVRNMSFQYCGEVGQCPLARVGDKLSDIDTPALVLDMDAFNSNLRSMKQWVEVHNSCHREEGWKLMLRPHAKTHKSAEVALRQIQDGGAIGVCVQKLQEATSMVEGGVLDVLVTNEIVGKNKIRRLLSIASHRSKPELAIIADNIENIHEIASEMQSQSSGAKIGVLIEINGGQNRCGVNCDSVDEITSIVDAIQSYSPHMYFKGIHCYGGGLQHVRSATERNQRVLDEPVSAAKKARDILSQHGVSCSVITGGGTGTFPFESAALVHNEIQPGSYVFMDVDYTVNEDGRGMFSNALFIHTSVVSTAVSPGERTIVDAGMKAVSLDSGPPAVTDSSKQFGMTDIVDESITYECGGDEHGILVHHKKDGAWKPGDSLRMIPGHIDPTVNMHDWLVCVETLSPGVEPVVVATWRIGGRGPGL